MKQEEKKSYLNIFHLCCSKYNNCTYSLKKYVYKMNFKIDTISLKIH